MFEVNTDGVTLAIKPLPSVKVNVGGGLTAVPTLVFMAQRAKNTPPIWLGIHVVEEHFKDWAADPNINIYTGILMGLEQLGYYPRSDLPRVVNNFTDLHRGKKKPVLYGNNDKDLLQAHFSNGCCIDVYRDPEAIQRVKEYGGFEGLVQVFGQHRTFFLYHRGVCLYNYLNETQAVEAVTHHLERLFPEVFAPAVVPGISLVHKRLRGKT